VVRLRSWKGVAGVAFAFAAAVLALAVAAWARSSGGSHRDLIVKGTNGPDVLTGTSRGDILEGLGGADRIYGLGGADRLYGAAGSDHLSGGPGADKLSGGPGADVIRCGSGRDVVYADSADRVAKDCEIVHRSSQAPSGGLARPGAYGGGPVSFRVQADGRTIVTLRVDYVGNCPPLGNSHISVANSGPWTIQPNRTFAVDDNDVDSSHLILTGSFVVNSASGSFDLHTTVDAGGEHLACDTGNVSWNAKVQQ
jgi:Ca2+-binding RTX toxin-like protein